LSIHETQSPYRDFINKKGKEIKACMFHLHEHNPHLYLRYKQTCEISGFDEGSNPVGYDVLPTFRKSLPLPFCMQYKTMAQDRHIQAEISSLARYLVSRGDGALKSVIFVERIP
jgi:hypothetical protein